MLLYSDTGFNCCCSTLHVIFNFVSDHQLLAKLALIVVVPDIIANGGFVVDPVNNQLAAVAVAPLISKAVFNLGFVVSSALYRQQ